LLLGFGFGVEEHMSACSRRARTGTGLHLHPPLSPGHPAPGGGWADAIPIPSPISPDLWYRFSEMVGMSSLGFTPLIASFSLQAKPVVCHGHQKFHHRRRRPWSRRLHPSTKTTSNSMSEAIAPGGGSLLCATSAVSSSPAVLQRPAGHSCSA
jgi:hypothetical protein